MKFLQINVDRRRVAQDLAFQTAAREGADFILVSEPNLSITRKIKSKYMDESESCCIIRRNASVKVWDWGKGDGYVWIHAEDIFVYCIYISPNVTEARYESFLNDLFGSIRGKGNKIVLGGDFNAKSPAWGSRLEDSRGRRLSEWAAERGLIPANTGNTPTFQRGSSQSVIDITFATEATFRVITAWKVLLEETGSLHNYIRFDVGAARPAKYGRRWKFSAAKFTDLFEEHLEGLRRATDAEKFVGILSTLQRRAMVMVRTDSKGNEVYWWTEEISGLRAASLRARRKVTRTNARRHVREEEVERDRLEYRNAKKTLKRAIARSKADCWRKLCDDLDNDIWGGGYKILVRSLKREPPRVNIDEDRRTQIADALFPVAIPTIWGTDMAGEELPFESVTAEEMLKAADRLKAGKAPGPDGILPEVIKITAKKLPDQMTKLWGGLMTDGRFPAVWKKGSLVLVPKPGKDHRQPNGYRPISLLSCAGKLLEAMILDRLEREMAARGPLHDLQFGFRKGRSAVDAVEEVLGTIRRAGAKSMRALILIDVKNAFNTASWPRIVEALRSKGVSGGVLRVICDYLNERSLQISADHVRATSIGVPQGSILGPTLWNALYDGVLRVERVPGTKLVAYADDLALVAEASSDVLLSRRCNIMLARVDGWMADMGLEIAPEKTEMVVFSRRNLRRVRVQVRGVDIAPSSSVKYLGVRIDKHLNFGAHIEEVCHKAEKTAGAVMRLMPNINGPSSKKRGVLAQVIYSTLLYAAPNWAQGLNLKKYKNKLISMQRKIALRVAGAYRTVSTAAVLVISGQIPIELLVDERRRCYVRRGDMPRAKEEERRTTFETWQTLFQNDTKGRWTASLIGGVEAWCCRKHGNVDYFLTQFLSGHGSFGNYLNRIGKAEDDACFYCGGQDSAEHAVFICPRSEEQRNEMRRRTGHDITRENLVRTALRSNDLWKATMGIIRDIMSTREHGMR